MTRVTLKIRGEDLKKKLIIRDGVDGIDGTVGEKGRDGKDGIDGKNSKPEEFLPLIEERLPSLGEKIRDGLELLQNEERLDMKAIKGLLETLEKLEKKKVVYGGGGGVVGRDLIKEIDISSQLDGVTKTFNIQGVWNIITVDLSSFPHALRKTMDYTWTSTSITFTDQIDAASSLAVGQTCILTVVSA